MSNTISEMRRCVEKFRIKISVSKTDYMDCNFTGTEVNQEISLEGNNNSKSTNFKYLGSVLSSEGDVRGRC